FGLCLPVLILGGAELVNLMELLFPHVGQSVRRELHLWKLLQQNGKKIVVLHSH
ncbi:hypothetical protein M9458_013549, partial [Cirrhinus mrigala]